MRKFEESEINELMAQEWQINAIKLNPEYVWWGNYEDYMTSGNSWDKSCEIESIDGLWELDELNELVNFYFELTRKSHTCTQCDGSGLNEKTKALSDDWYSHMGSRWQYRLTEHEVEALIKAGRLNDLLDGRYRYEEEKSEWCMFDREKKEWVVCYEPKYPTPQEVNLWARKGFGHDSINHWIATKARAEKEGYYGKCECCGGNGYVYDEDFATLSLQMWFIHPRKGASRGVYLKNIKDEQELHTCIEYLKQARDRNYERFSLLG